MYINKAIMYLCLMIILYIAAILYVIWMLRVLYLLTSIYRSYYKQLKQSSSIMATLAEFQSLAQEIHTAAQTISTYIQGTGMSAAEQTEALSAIQTAVQTLVAAVSTSPVVTEVPPTE